MTEQEEAERRHMADEEDRFWDKVRIGDGCWEWTGRRDKDGYGRGRAHRKSYELRGSGQDVRRDQISRYGHHAWRLVESRHGDSGAGLLGCA